MFNFPVKFFKTFSIIVVLFSGCGMVPDEYTVPVNVYPLPSPLDSIDVSYLPYEYLNDGCQYRAMYLGMELAARDIPSAAIIAQSCQNKKELNGQAGARWSFHASIAVGSQDSFRIIEPLLSDSFCSYERWRTSFGTENLLSFFTSPAYPFENGSKTDCGSLSDLDKIVDSVSRMTAWDKENVLISCSYLKTFLQKTGKPGWQERSDRLSVRTKELIIALAHRQLIVDGILPLTVEEAENIDVPGEIELP